MSEPKFTPGQICYDFDPGSRAAHPYRNNPNRWLLQARERETWERKDYRGIRSRCTHWTRWRTVYRYRTPEEAFAALLPRQGRGLAQWRVTWGGKIQESLAGVLAKARGEKP